MSRRSCTHPVKAAEIVIPSSEQVTALLDSLAGHRLHPIAAIALGATRGGGLHFKEPKDRYGRRVLQHPEMAIAALKEQRRQQQEQRLKVGLGRAAPGDLVFTLADGGPWDPDYLSHHRFSTLAALNQPPLGLYSLRHAHASVLIAAKVDPLTISRRLGHATPAFTLAVYGHLFADTDAEAARAIDAALRTKT